MKDTDKGKRVTLRAMEPEDLDLLYRIENDRKLWNVGSSNVPYSRYTLHDYIANARNDIYVDGQVRLMIENDAKKVVGIIDLVNFDPKHQRAELGIVIIDKFRRQGYAHAAIHQIIEYVRNVLHLRQIYAFVSIDNKVSLSCMRSLGFIEGAVLKEWMYFEGSYHDAFLMQFFL